MAAEAEHKVTLVSADDVPFDTTVDVVSLSAVIREVIKEGALDGPMTVPNVRSTALKMVLSYCEYHLKTPPPTLSKPLPPKPLEELVDEFDAKLVDLEAPALNELFAAGSYLDIQSLVDLCAAKMAVMIRGKTVEEVRKILNIVNDYTPEEEAKIRAENAWCEPTVAQSKSMADPDRGEDSDDGESS
eukprot:Selendium_serpulae@DN5316_c0_g1_i1.p2